MTENEIQQILDAVIAESAENPVDLLGIGDEAGETSYIDHARRSYQRTLLDIAALPPVAPGRSGPVRILEIGSYLGVVSVSLARMGYSVTALDIPEFMGNRRLKERYDREGVSAIAANLREYRLPADSESFDMVIMCETLEHMNFNPLPVLFEINRVLARGGYLYLALPNLTSLVNRAKLLFGCSIHNPVPDFAEQLGGGSNMIVGIHWREYTGEELRKLVSLAGFAVMRHYFFTAHTPSLPARLIYLLFPWLRQNQTLIAAKESTPALQFHFTDASR